MNTDNPLYFLPKEIEDIIIGYKEDMEKIYHIENTIDQLESLKVDNTNFKIFRHNVNDCLKYLNYYFLRLITGVIPLQEKIVSIVYEDTPVEVEEVTKGKIKVLKSFTETKIKIYVEKEIDIHKILCYGYTDVRIVKMDWDSVIEKIADRMDLNIVKYIPDITDSNKVIVYDLVKEMRIREYYTEEDKMRNKLIADKL